MAHEWMSCAQGLRQGREKDCPRAPVRNLSFFGQLRGRKTRQIDAKHGNGAGYCEHWQRRQRFFISCFH